MVMTGFTFSMSIEEQAKYLARCQKNAHEHNIKIAEELHKLDDLKRFRLMTTPNADLGRRVAVGSNVGLGFELK